MHRDMQAQKEAVLLLPVPRRGFGGLGMSCPHSVSGLAPLDAWLPGPTSFCFVKEKCEHSHRLLCWEGFAIEPEPDWQ